MAVDRYGLGIPGVAEAAPGTHLCALYSGPAARDRLLLAFLEEGLRRPETCLCLTDPVEPASVGHRAVGDASPLASPRSAQLDVERAADAFLRAGALAVDDLTGYLAERANAAIGDDSQLLRAAGEMTWVLPQHLGEDELFHYESRLDAAVGRLPAVVMCMYDLEQFGAAMLIEVLRTHPMVLLDRTLTDNPFYAPERCPQRDAAAPRLPVDEVAVAGADAADRRWGSLTVAELRVVSCVARAMTNRTIAEKLFLSRHTVDAHLKHVYRKLGIHSRVELTLSALQRRLPAA